MGVTSLFVFWKLGRPVLFIQERAGFEGKIFKILKFRTMTDERDEDGVLLDDAERLTPFGNFLRSSSLDELPELFNVLLGDMALVGPRPLLPEYLPLYSDNQKKRHKVKPGITGYAQIKGRNELSWEERLALDVWYAENKSFLLDVRILIATIGVVFKQEGIRHGGHSTMPRFRKDQ